MLRKSAFSMLLVVAGLAISATTASAAPNNGVQSGLVNIAVVDVLNNNQVNVQVPIGVAANVCGLTVGVIADQQPAPVDCTSATTQDLPAAFNPTGNGGGGGANNGAQQGLVNIAIVDVLNNNQVNVQVPIGVAANVCGVAVGVIAQQQPAPVDCTSRTTQDLPVAFR